MQAAGEDRAVRIGAPRTRHHPEDAVARHVREFAGRDAVGDQDFADAGGEFFLLAARLAGQRALHSRDHVVDVLAAAAQVRIVHAVEYRNQPVALCLQGRGRAVTTLADHPAQTLDQVRVLEQLRVGVDEFADLAGQRAVQLAPKFGHVFAGRREGTLEARDFLLDLVFGKRRVVDAEAGGLLEAYPPERHARRGDIAGESAPHAPSSNLRSNSAATGASAASSSGPSARRVRGVPMLAASIITPMMLFALTSRPPATSQTVELNPCTNWTSLADARACKPSLLLTTISLSTIGTFRNGDIPLRYQEQGAGNREQGATRCAVEPCAGAAAKQNGSGFSLLARPCSLLQSLSIRIPLRPPLAATSASSSSGLSG